MATPKPPPRWTHWLPLLYLVFGTVWILASDSVVGWMFGNAPHRLVVVSAVKGFAFVALTALVLALWWRAEQRYNTALVEAAEARASFAAERMAWMSRHANDVILLLDAEGQILDCNERAEALYRLSRAELLALNAIDLRPSNERTQSIAMLRRVLDSDQIVYETVHMRRDGTTVPLQVSATGVVFKGERYVQCVVRDQTELVAARRRLERQRDLYDLLSRCSQAAARMRDRQSLYESVVRLAVEHGRFRFSWIAELQPGDEMRKTAWYGDDQGYMSSLEVNARADDPRGQGPGGRSLREGTTVVVNDFARDPSVAPWHEAARKIGLAASAAVPFRARGRIVGALQVYSSEAGIFDAQIVQTLEEIAEEIGFALEAHEVRKELQESRNLLQTVIDASATPIYAFDLDGRLLLINEAGTRVAGRPREQLLGRTREALASKADATAHRVSDQQVLASGEPAYVEETIGSGERERAFLSVKYPLRDLAGRVYAVGGISTEITELRRAQRQVSDANVRLEEVVAQRTRELRVARDRAEQADRAKTAFLSTISHELRTPLNSIIGFTDIVLQELSGPLNDEQRRQLTMVHDSSRLLLDLINEMLDLSRIEAGRLQLQVETFDLRGLLHRRVEALKPLSDAKGLRLDMELDAGIGKMTSDAKRVAQIVTNLVSNAIKFTATGDVQLTARVDGSRVSMSVQDTGPGIAPEDMDNLFKPFMQGSDAQRRHREGTGLGLAISRHLARALGGDIAVTSEPGRGSCFTVTLPLTSTTGAEAASGMVLGRRSGTPEQALGNAVPDT